MRLLRSGKASRTFHFSRKEMTVFRALLTRYPLVPSAYQPLSRSGTDPEGIDQRLLDEALAEQRQENKRQLLALLKNRRRFRQTQSGWQLTLSPPELDGLLQVLNDIRVGSWIRLGSPPDGGWDFGLDPTTVPHAWAMEMAGYFQMHFLEALPRGGEP
jgi:hypothetical protein